MKIYYILVSTRQSTIHPQQKIAMHIISATKAILLHVLKYIPTENFCLY